MLRGSDAYLPALEAAGVPLDQIPVCLGGTHPDRAIADVIADLDIIYDNDAITCTRHTARRAMKILCERNW